MSATALSVKEAASLTGRSKQGILKSIHAGRLSATRGDNQEWLIEPVELARVFDVVTTNHSTNGANHDAVNEVEVSSSCQIEVDGLRVEVAHQKQLLAMSEASVADLRRMVDVLTNENNRLSAIVAQLAPPKAKAGWWQRLLGGD